MAGFCYAIYGYVAYSMFSSLDSDEFGKDGVLLVALFWPKCLMGFLFGASFMVLAIRDWHGNVHRMLLLKLLDVQQKNKDSDSATPEV